MVSTPSRWTNGLRWSLNKQIKTKKKKGEVNLGMLLINLRNDFKRNFKNTKVFGREGKPVDSISTIKLPPKVLSELSLLSLYIPGLTQNV